jgi:hypothetical protein
MTVLELRCPEGFRELLATYRIEGERPTVDRDTNLMVLACRACRRQIERTSGTRPKRVLHLYDLSGSLVDTEVEW